MKRPIQTKESPVPAGLQKDIDRALEYMLGIEEKEYHNDLVPFSRYKDGVKARGHESFRR